MSLKPFAGVSQRFCIHGAARNTDDERPIAHPKPTLSLQFTTLAKPILSKL